MSKFAFMFRMCSLSGNLEREGNRLYKYSASAMLTVRKLTTLNWSKQSTVENNLKCNLYCFSIVNYSCVYSNQN